MPTPVPMRTLRWMLTRTLSWMPMPMPMRVLVPMRSPMPMPARMRMRMRMLALRPWRYRSVVVGLSGAALPGAWVSGRAGQRSGLLRRMSERSWAGGVALLAAGQPTMVVLTDAPRDSGVRAAKTMP